MNELLSDQIFKAAQTVFFACGVIKEKIQCTTWDLDLIE